MYNNTLYGVCRRFRRHAPVGLTDVLGGSYSECRACSASGFHGRNNNISAIIIDGEIHIDAIREKSEDGNRARDDDGVRYY